MADFNINLGKIKADINSPLNPFGSVHVESLTPIFQTDAVYGFNDGQLNSFNAGSGTATANNNVFEVSTGTTMFSQGVILGKKRLRYRAGQGVVGRFTGLFHGGVANSYAIAGFGTATDGVYFGYGDTNDLSNTEFGILYVRGGVREVKTLTVTTGATSSGNVTVTLNGNVYTVAVTNSSNIQRTVWEISQGDFGEWDAYPQGATVVFVRKSAGATAGTQSFSSGTTGAAATIVQTTEGAASVDTFIPQSQWNGDTLDGSEDENNPSGVLLDPTKGNVYQIGIKYLGFGSITFKVETLKDGVETFTTVHTLEFPNNLTETSFTNPSFPFTMAAYSAGSTTNVSVKVGSFAGFIEGQKVLQGNRYSYFNNKATVGATDFTALFTVLNKRVYKGKVNQSVINLLSTICAVKHNNPVVFYLIKNGSLVGNPNFVDTDTDSSTCTDTAATAVTFANNSQLIWTGHLGETGGLDHKFSGDGFNADEITLQPGEWVTLAVKTVFGNANYVTGSINTREDQ